MRYSDWEQRQMDIKSGEELDRAARVRRPPMCEGCYVNRSDPPSKLCVGCQAYQEHQR